MRYMKMAKAKRRLPTPWNWAATQWLRSSSVLKVRGPLRTGLGYVIQRVWAHVLSVTPKCFLWKIGAEVHQALLQRLKKWAVSLLVLRPYAALYIKLVCMVVTPGGSSSEDDTQESFQTVCWRHVNKAHRLLEPYPMVWWDED